MLSEVFNCAFMLHLCVEPEESLDRNSSLNVLLTSVVHCYCNRVSCCCFTERYWKKSFVIEPWHYLHHVSQMSQYALNHEQYFPHFILLVDVIYDWSQQLLFQWRMMVYQTYKQVSRVSQTSKSWSPILLNLLSPLFWPSKCSVFFWNLTLCCVQTLCWGWVEANANIKVNVSRPHFQV